MITGHRPESDHDRATQEGERLSTTDLRCRAEELHGSHHAGRETHPQTFAERLSV